ncbi:MAG: sodium-independent anion transporter, partial [Nodularia sp. (in: cyanobacteria)]|nr:sodium-independent anion transporter [Nodularia sp. (in: cyanobacteria)]
SDRVKASTEVTNELRLTPEEQDLLTRARGRILLFQLGGPMSFGAAKVISQRMAIIKDYTVLLLDMSDVSLLGVTAALAIETMVEDAVAKNRHVFLVGATGNIEKRIKKLRLLQRFSLVYQVENRFQALESALELILSATQNQQFVNQDVE